MQVVGYANAWTVRPGDSVGLHVSCREPNYRVSVLRMRHGDNNPTGPGFVATSVPTEVNGRYPGSWHDVPSGSYAIVDAPGQLLNSETVTIAVWVYPTAPSSTRQAILSRGANGLCLAVDKDGRPTVAIGSEQLRGPDPLAANQWYLLVVRMNRRTKAVDLLVRPRDLWPGSVPPSTTIEPIAHDDRWIGPLVLAARVTSDGMADHFNGKIDSPIIFSSWLSDRDVYDLMRGHAEAPVQARWNLGADHATLVVPSDPEGWGLRLVGMPTRAVTGHRANGETLRPSDRPNHYTAIHFHDDDKDDAGWPEALRLSIPDGWPSGIYAFHLETDAGEEDHVPFFVLPKRDGPRAPVAFLAPTFSYICYGNVHYSHAVVDAAVQGTLPTEMLPHDRYIRDQRLGSTYDLHRADRSGVTYVSRLLPQVHVRPKQKWSNGSPHQFNADLHLVDWLHVKGFEHDVLTDEALHHEGLELLEPYKVVLTGTHPEYWSGDMLDAIHAYLKQGGRVMYMGGNGFYWVTSVHPCASHVLEVRKFGGTRTWTAQPDERHHSTTGEQGGIWRDRGHAPQKMLGVGFAAEGFATNAPYRRTEASFTGPLAELFEGIESHIIGNTPSLVLATGAAGFEIDRIDYALGSPPNTVCLARSFGHNELYQLCYEEALAFMVPSQLGPGNPDLHADIAYLEYPDGGAVFSTGSISYCGALSYNKYTNDISRLTENVLRKFMRNQQPV